MRSRAGEIKVRSRPCERSPEFKLTNAVLEYEAHFIEQALEEEQGSVTRAAKKLGITHQGLAFILETRQPQLFSKRKAPRKRKRSIITKKPSK
jgi:transcriptional regulator with PAS, ATPase and Fis domain